MPQNPNIIATKTVMGPVYIFDRTRHPSQPTADSVCTPDLRLTGHTREGQVFRCDLTFSYGISWHRQQEGYILSASEDSTVCYW